MQGKSKLSTRRFARGKKAPLVSFRKSRPPFISRRRRRGADDRVELIPREIEIDAQMNVVVASLKDRHPVSPRAQVDLCYVRASAPGNKSAEKVKRA